MTKGEFPAAKNLIDRAASNALDDLASSIAGAVQSGLDPYGMAGLLVEAIAVTIAGHVPPEQQPDIALAAIELLHERLSTHELI